MRIVCTILVLSMSVTTAIAQKWRANLFAGLTGYNGDLRGRATDMRGMKPAIGLGLQYELTEKINLRAGITAGKFTARDRWNVYNQSLVDRNLDVTTPITEFHVAGEYLFKNLYDRDWTPYVFGGVALFRFNPYTKDASGNKIYLQPLGTEGQGLAAYPDRKKYKRTQFSIPFGGGFKFVLSERIQLGAELGFRKTFTDYLDDVSSGYADETILRAGNGNLAADLAFRGDELKGLAYPAESAIRGNPKLKDLYAFGGFTVSYQLGKNGRGLFQKNKYGCPKVY
jgi:hypothetical protein